MSLLAPGVKDRLYEEVYCLKDMSMIHVDLGNIEVKKGESYYSYIGEEYLDEFSPQNRFLVKVGAFLWPFNKKHFGTLRELREKQLNDLGI
jgi:hypothetical protein